MTMTQSSLNVEQLHALAQQLRIDSIRSSTAAGSGHPTSSLSAADLLAVLVSKYLQYDFSEPANPASRPAHQSFPIKQIVRACQVLIHTDAPRVRT